MSLSSEQQAAVEVAKKALAATAGARGVEYTVRSVEARQWRDSSLGCPRPDAMYLQVITDGYAVVLEAGGQAHEVRVAGDNAVLCQDAVQASQPRQPLRSPVRVTNLKAMESLAVADLARRLGVEAGAVRVMDRVAEQWTPAAFECRAEAPGATAAKPSLNGFKLLLRHRERTYTYHTDLKRIVPCPQIEQQ